VYYHEHPEEITSKAVHLVAIPTTAGTGSEASLGAGIHPDSTSRSAGVSSEHLVPKVAICDPNLTLSLPPDITAATGMDALSHCVEGFLAKSVNRLLTPSRWMVSGGSLLILNAPSPMETTARPAGR